jgi:hypothetical protein
MATVRSSATTNATGCGHHCEAMTVAARPADRSERKRKILRPEDAMIVCDRLAQTDMLTPTR